VVSEARSRDFASDPGTSNPGKAERCHRLRNTTSVAEGSSRASQRSPPSYIVTKLLILPR